ncbi:MAG: SurA N-terminal domain-containing protein [Pseudomonadota bacterium]
MLQTIRSAADNVLFRIMLIIIVVSFAFWGVKDNLNTVGGSDVVTFKNSDPITVDEFARAKALEISRIQRMSGKILAEEDMQQINKIVLEKLIAEKLLNFAVKEYGVNFDDKTTAQLIKQISVFHDKNGVFDIELLKASARNAGMTEEEFSEFLKNKLMQNTVVNLYASTTIIPQTLMRNIVDFMSTECVVDIASKNLDSFEKGVSLEATSEQLEDFYKEHIELFTAPEKRSISYIVINPAAVKKQVVVKPEDAKKFFDENKDEFNGRSFEKMQSDIMNLLSLRYAEEMMNEINKTLEDEVAAGSSLQEIAKKMKFPLQGIKAADALALQENKDIGVIAESVLGLQSGEVSYPLELPEGKGVVLVEILDITPKQTKDFQSISGLVLQKWKEESIRDMNMKIMQDFVDTATKDDFNSKAAALKLTLAKGNVLQRAKLSEVNDLPPAMLVDIFSLAKAPNVLSKIYTHQGKVFAVLVKSIAYNKNLADDITKTSGEHIDNRMREGLFLELMNALKDIQDVRIDEASPAFR